MIKIKLEKNTGVKVLRDQGIEQLSQLLSRREEEIKRCWNKPQRQEFVRVLLEEDLRVLTLCGYDYLRMEQVNLDDSTGTNASQVAKSKVTYSISLRTDDDDDFDDDDDNDDDNDTEHDKLCPGCRQIHAAEPKKITGRHTPCDDGDCPFDAVGGMDCRDYCGLGVDDDDEDFDDDFDDEEEE